MTNSDKSKPKARALREATARSALSTIVDSDRSDIERALALLDEHLNLSLTPGEGAAEVVAEQLRDAILDLAVRGRLVSQDPNDEPASVLRERITELRKRKRLPEVDAEELGYPLPDAWVTSRLPSLGEWAGGTGFPKSFQGSAEGDYLFCKVADMNLDGNERCIMETENRVDVDAVTQMRALVHLPGTVVFPKIGGAVATNKRRVLVKPTIIDNNCLASPRATASSPIGCSSCCHRLT